MKKGWKAKLHQDVPLSKALIWIFLTTFLISGSATLGWLNYERLVAKRLQNPAYALSTLIIKGDGLDPQYLAEKIGLSKDRATNYYEFDPYEAKARLEASPLIQSATVDKQKPNLVLITYTPRTPIAKVADVSNTLIDDQGVLIPQNPLFTQLPLPAIRFGFDPSTFKYGLHVEGRRWDLAKEFISLHESFTVTEVDLTNAYANSYGEREVVLTIAEGERNRILRLSTRRSRQEIHNYLNLRDEITNRGEPGITDKDLVIDLRLPQLAYMKPYGGENVGVYPNTVDSGKH